MQTSVLKIGAGFAGVGVVAIAAIAAWISLSWPPTFQEVPTPEIEATDDPEVIAEGEYLFHTVAHCTACHVPKETVFSMEDGERLAPVGGTVWEFGPLGTLRSPNITSHPQTGIGDWTDGEIARVIRHGIRPDDKPAMMMTFAGPLSDEDLTAIISYMRTIEPVDNATVPADVTLFGKAMFRGPLSFFASPRPPEMTPPDYVPRGEVSVERGRYLTDGPGMCVYCHSELDVDTGEIEGLPFAGGTPEPDLTDSTMEIVAPNITTGGVLENWTKEIFMTRMRGDRAVEGSNMPWENYRGMTDEDLESIYLYLQSVEPSDNDVGPQHRPSDWEPEDA